MKKERKDIKKKLLSTSVVLAMILSSMVLLISPAISVEEEVSGLMPSVRIYGEEEAVYPTQSYYGSNDFIYPLEYDPFDPGVIEKDSITFNPAFIDGHAGEYEIRAQGDASEKIFLRAFYEPGYTHPIDQLMDKFSDVTLYPVEEFDAIVTETTYFLVTLNERDPTVGYGQPDLTKMYLPYASMDPVKPGMDEAGLVDVVLAGDAQTSQLTDGGIFVMKEFEFYDGSYVGETIRFMDHKVKIVNFEDNDPTDDKLDVQVSYVGNMDDALSSTQTLTIPSNFFGSSFPYYFDRLNNDQFSTDPAFRWFLYVISADDDYLRIALGRVLVAGETFYVDGVRYDMPAIYVDDDDGFKYITLQSPIPKCETIWDYPLYKNVDDFSHVTSQYLANLPLDTPVWVLPPFDDDHTMIDDIDLDGDLCDPNSYRIPLAGLMIEDEKSALEFYYIEESIEERFDSSLTERLNTSEDEEWEWYNIYTMPNRFTEFALPNQETTDDTYVEEGGYADGNEYLITTSLIAPNSNVDTDRSDNCKGFDEHEIFDRVYDIALNDERVDYYEMPRFVYEFDAVDPTDFYINEGGANPSVRIYGEEDVFYPTQSYMEEFDFIYDEEFHPFDPGVIIKDSITFNPALIDGHGGEYEIRAQGDASEKVFLRAFYEPGYTHPIDELMDDNSDVTLYPVEEFDGIVTETTYFLVTLSEYGRDPTVGYPGSTEFMLPYCSMDPVKPGMDEAALLDLAWADDMGTSQLTDGAIAVEKQFEFDNIDYTEDIAISFMDHKIIIKNFEDNDPLDDKLDLDVLYVGNMNEAIPAMETVTIWENSFGIGPQYRMYFNRENQMMGPFSSDPAFRWYLRIENADLDYLRITLGRELWAGETFYVDGVRYDMPAVYVAGDNIKASDDDDDSSAGFYDDGFKYITLQSPIPKCETIWVDNPLSENVDDFSHVTSQYLANLPLFTNVWLLPPFDDDHTMIDDIDLHKDFCGGNCYSVPLAGLIIEDEKSALEFYYIEESVEERFDSSLTERLQTDDRRDQDDDDDDERWEWYNVYTMPNRYTEFILPDQETTSDSYVEESGYADGNEYLITSSLIAPNSELDTDRRDECKYYKEHEIFGGIEANLVSYGSRSQEIETAIIDGLAWLVDQQDVNGGWNAYNGHWEAGTGLALYKLCERAYELGYSSPFDVDYEYHDDVIDGFNWAFDHLSIHDIGPQDHTTGATGTVDNPDTNGNGIGVCTRYGTNYESYSTGILLAGISASRTPSRVVNVPGSPVDGWTYGQVVQDMVDFLAFSQVEYPVPGITKEGGWDYWHVDNGVGGSSWKGDNSVSGYAILGLAEAQVFGATIPQWVKTELNEWIDWVQDDITGDTNDGGSWYSAPGDGIGVNSLKTGNLLTQMALFGDNPSTPRVIDAIDYIERHWYDASGANSPPGWNGNPAQYQAMFCLMKGLVYIGIDTFDGINWFDDISTVILAQQDKTVGPTYGSWRSSSGRGEPVIITEWALLTLEKIAPPPIQKMHPRFVFEFDASDGTGLFINGEQGQPPTADAGGPYNGDCTEATSFDGSGSYDNDEGGSSIVQYDWKFSSSDSWHNDMGPNPTNLYGSAGTYTVTLRVHDDEGATDTDSDNVYITCIPGDDDDDVTGAVVIMEDVNPCVEETDYGYLKALNIAENVGSCEITISWDTDVVTVIDVDDGEFENLVPTIDNIAGELTIVAFNTVVELTGDFTIARIEFGAVGDNGDSCTLRIEDSDLLTADAIEDEITHSRDHGRAIICEFINGCDGDMNGNGETNSNDVRYLAKHIAGDPLYETLYSEGDVNGNGAVNSADVRYLALHIAGDSEYGTLCPVI